MIFIWEAFFKGVPTSCALFVEDRIWPDRCSGPDHITSLWSRLDSPCTSCLSKGHHDHGFLKLPRGLPAPPPRARPSTGAARRGRSLGTPRAPRGRGLRPTSPHSRFVPVLLGSTRRLVSKPSRTMSPRMAPCHRICGRLVLPRVLLYVPKPQVPPSGHRASDRRMTPGRGGGGALSPASLLRGHRLPEGPPSRAGSPARPDLPPGARRVPRLARAALGRLDRATARGDSGATADPRGRSPW